MIDKVLVVYRVVTGMGPKALLHNFLMWKHIGTKSTHYSPSNQLPDGTELLLFGATPLLEGPRKSPRDALNRAVRELKKSPATHMLVLDDDILGPPNLVDLLLQADKPIVGALIHRSDGSPLVWERHLNGERPMYGHPATGVFQCHAVALGAMMIRREVFDQMSDPWFFFERNGRTMDVNFCIEAKKADIEVWCSVDATCKQIIHEEREI